MGDDDEHGELERASEATRREASECASDAQGSERVCERKSDRRAPRCTQRILSALSSDEERTRTDGTSFVRRRTRREQPRESKKAAAVSQLQHRVNRGCLRRQSVASWSLWAMEHAARRACSRSLPWASFQASMSPPSLKTMSPRSASTARRSSLHSGTRQVKKSTSA